MLSLTFSCKADVATASPGYLITNTVQETD
jgi:hypothetical protein